MVVHMREEKLHAKKHSAESLENSPRTRRNSTGRAELGKTEELHRDKLRRRAQLQAPAAKQPRRPTTTLDARLAFWKRRQNSESTGGRGYAEGHGEETARCEGGARRRTADNAIPIAARKNTELENNANKWNAPKERCDLLESERGRPVESIGQELNVENAQIRTLLDRQKERILAECRAEIEKHELQADYGRSARKLGEIIDSQQEELHCAQAEELQRRDQQLLHERVLQQNSE